MADKTATFRIDLEQTGANEAAAELAKLRATIDEDTSALKGMQAAMKNLQGGSAVNVQAFKSLAAQINAKKISIASAQESYVGLGGSFAKVAKEATKVKDVFKETAAATTKLKGAVKEASAANDNAKGSVSDLMKAAKAGMGPMGGLFEKAEALKGAIGAAGLVAVAVAAAAAMAALTAAVIAGYVALAQFAIVSSDASRSQFLLLEGLTGSEDAAYELQGAIDGVSRGVAISSEKVSGYAKELYQAGLRGGELEDALEAVSISSSVMGDSAAADFMKAAKAAKTAGQSVDALSATVKGKLGGVAAAQMLSLTVQTAKAKENIGKLFAGLNVEPFLKGLQAILAVFDETTSAGQAIKTIVEVMFQPIADAVEFLGPLVAEFFKGVIIVALLCAIAFLTIRNALRDAFGDSDALSQIDWLKVAMWGGVAAGIALAAVLGLLAVALAGVGITLAAVAIWFLSPFILAAGVVYALYWAGKKVVEFFAGVDWSALGKAIVDGIVGGITNGAKWVVDAVSNLATKAKNAFMEVLGMGSPSRVFAELGGFTAEGYAQGVDDGSAEVNASVASMVAVPAPMGGAVSNNTSKSTGPITIYLSGEPSTEGLAKLKATLLDIFEGAAISVGSPMAETSGAA